MMMVQKQVNDDGIMMCFRSIKKHFFFIAMLMPFVFASDVTSDRVLQNLFGSVNNLLNGYDGLTALQFKIFNVSIMVFATLFVGATLTQGVIQTAGQGVLLGRKQGQSSYYTLFRSGTGLAFVFPTYNGYSIIQYLVMSVVLQSTDLATNISQAVLSQSMLYNIEDMIGDTVKGTDPRETSLVASQLSNLKVQNFYRSITAMAEESVQWNRQLPVSLSATRGSQLYSIQPHGSKYRITFKGLNPEATYIEVNGYPQSEIFNESLNLMISPIVNKLFRCLPNAVPFGKDARVCKSGPEPVGSCGQTREEVLDAIKFGIESTHDATFASLFVLPELADTKSGTISQIKFKPNWLQFPFLYQSAQEVKAAGMSATDASDLVSKAYNFSNGTFINVSPTTAKVQYTHLGEDAEGAGILNYVPSNYGSGIFSGEFVLSNTAGSVNILSSEEDTATARNAVKNYLYKFIDRGNQAQFFDSPQTTLADLWADTNYWSDIQSRSNPGDFSSFDAERRAMIQPVQSFVYHTGTRWIDTYVGKDANSKPKIAIEPVSSLTKLASETAQDSILMMFTLMRNVVAEQILNAYASFWDFFAIKMALTVGTAGTQVLQDALWDKMSCNILSVLPGTGASPRVPFCEWIITPSYPIPLPNPAWPPGFITATVMAGVTMGINAGMTIGDEVATGLFMLDWFIKTQFAYQYYGYIIMAMMPVMIVSNLLAIWVPMLPPIVFFLAVIGWVIAVIEAMIASPLILLGMTFPQGHDFLGSSQQALILLLGVFIRAPLIIFGFFAGMLVLQISMVMLGVAVVPIVLNLFDTSTSSPSFLSDAFMMYAFMVILMYLTGTLVSQTLSLTYKLPNSIVRWVGSSPPEGIEDAAVAQIQRVVNQQQQGMLDSIKQAGLSSRSDRMAGAATGGVSAGGKVGGGER